MKGIASSRRSRFRATATRAIAPVPTIRASIRSDSSRFRLHVLLKEFGEVVDGQLGLLFDLPEGEPRDLIGDASVEGDEALLVRSHEVAVVQQRADQEIAADREDGED